MTAHAGAERLVWLDYVRGGGLVLVAFAHAFGGVAVASQAGWPATHEAVRLFLAAFLMPPFFALSGWIAFRYPPRSARAFASATLWTLVVPYLVWSVVLVLVRVAFASRLNHPATLDPLLWIATTPVEYLWFLYVLFFVRVGFQLVLWAGFERLAAPLAVAGLLAWGAIDRGVWPFLVNETLMGVGFYAAGYVAARERWLERVRRPLPVAAFAGVVFLVCGFVVWPLQGASPQPLMALALVAAAALALRDASPPASLAGRAFAFLGEQSLGVYVVHGLFTAGARIALTAVGIASPPVLIAASTIAGLVGPALVVLAAQRLGVAPYLGLGRSQRSRYLGRAS